MLLANLAKSDRLVRLVELKRAVPTGLSKSERAIDQLMDCFVKGAESKYNKNTDFDYLSYLFADLAKVKVKIAKMIQLPTAYLYLRLYT